MIPAPIEKTWPFIPAPIPETLKALARWAPWVASFNPKRQKWDKVPHQFNALAKGLSTAHPERWASFENALSGYLRSLQPAAPVRCAGLGFVMTRKGKHQHRIVGIDLDGCVENGVLEDWAQAIVDQLKSYTELSPSGRGVRIFCLGEIASDWMNHSVGIEVYAGHRPRFLTVTGDWLEGKSRDLVEVAPEVLQQLEVDYAKVRADANLVPLVGDLVWPEMLDELALPDVASLPLPAAVAALLERGECEDDRSRVVHAAGISLYAAGYDDATVFSILASNEHVMEIAMSHRNGDQDRAYNYLWREHCLKARARGQGAVATADEFDVVEVTAGPAEGQVVIQGQVVRDRPALVRDRRTGQALPTMTNITMALRRDLCGMDIRYDNFTCEIVYSTAGGEWKDWRRWHDTDYTRLQLVLERTSSDAMRFARLSREDIKWAVRTWARDRTIDAAIEWLNGLVWDGVPRVEGFFTNYFGAEDSAYVRGVSRYLWTGLAGRVLQPGIKCDMVPILVSGQGTIKSSAIAAIVRKEHFTTMSLADKGDNVSRTMVGRLLAEIPELHGLRTRELEYVKAFITRTHESWIPKYFEAWTEYGRRMLFIGTSNTMELLDDETGNRRFLPFKVGRADIAAVSRDRDQLWAEAACMFAVLGVDYHLAEQLAPEVHADFTVTEPWAEYIETWLDTEDTVAGGTPRTREFFRMEEIAREALRLDSSRFTKASEQRIGKAMRELGYERDQRRFGDQVTKVWVKKGPKA
jgi:predicted P-loop ATPase